MERQTAALRELKAELHRCQAKPAWFTGAAWSEAGLPDSGAISVEQPQKARASLQDG